MPRTDDFEDKYMRLCTQRCKPFGSLVQSQSLGVRVHHPIGLEDEKAALFVNANGST
jgi:hypothetical protein